MIYPTVYVNGKGRYVNHFMELIGVGDVLVVQNVNAAVQLLAAQRGEYGFLFFEQEDVSLDVPQLRLLRSWFKSFGIILITHRTMSSDERGEYLKAGVNTALRNDVDAQTLHQTMSFMVDHTFQYQAVVTSKASEVALFRIPLWKRSFDVMCASVAILLLSPLFVLVALAIKIDSHGPILYRSKRVGSNYRVFDFLKFRSMRVNADRKLKQCAKNNQYACQTDACAETGQIALSEEDMEQIMKSVDSGMLLSDDALVNEEDLQRKVTTEQKNAFVKIENDPRVTRLGRFLRKYSIDELPQLFNILRGDMSVVGNRPLPLYEAEHLTGDEYVERFMCPSGLTGLWQVEKRGGRGKLSPEQRKQLDIRYAKEMSLWLDIKLIFRTFTSFIQKENV
ncbi:MAG: sugar transferase [Alistipes sp.]